MKKEYFCFPSDFYYINWESVKMLYKINKIRTIVAILGVISLGTICMIGYYILFSFRWINEKCENWCYR